MGQQLQQQARSASRPPRGPAAAGAGRWMGRKRRRRGGCRTQGNGVRCPWPCEGMQGRARSPSALGRRMRAARARLWCQPWQWEGRRVQGRSRAVQGAAMGRRSGSAQMRARGPAAAVACSRKRRRGGGAAGATLTGLRQQHATLSLAARGHRRSRLRPSWLQPRARQRGPRVARGTLRVQGTLPQPPAAGRLPAGAASRTGESPRRRGQVPRQYARTGQQQAQPRPRRITSKSRSSSRAATRRLPLHPLLRGRPLLLLHLPLSSRPRPCSPRRPPRPAARRRRPWPRWWRSGWRGTARSAPSGRCS